MSRCARRSSVRIASSDKPGDASVQGAIGIRAAGLWLHLVWARIAGRDFRTWARSDTARIRTGHWGGAITGPLPRLTLRHLLNTYGQFPEEIKHQKTICGVTIGLGVARYYLGLEWLERNINPDAKPSGFLRWVKNVSAEATMQVFRTTDLGELLFNLQDVTGFDALMERMKTGDAESYMAELRIGRLLYVNDVKFRFNVPHGRSQEDYDLEIVHPGGGILCADTKCKIETTQFSENSIRNALDKARKQLPPEGAGMIYLLVPGHWLEVPDSQQKMIETAQDFLRTTGRVVMVTYYAEPLSYTPGVMRQGHRFREIQNPRRSEQDWSLVQYMPRTNYWDALPEKWVRLVNFPHEVRNFDRFW
jgi:hypothetical protein